MAKKASKRSSKANKRSNFSSLLKQRYVLPALVVLVFGGVGTYYLAASHASTTNCYNYSVRQHAGFWSGEGYQVGGSKGQYQGACISRIQILVNFQLYGSNYGSNPNHIATDGRYGSLTAKAVAKMQSYYKGHGFPGVSVDGSVGPQTFNNMLCRLQSINGNYDFWNNTIESALNYMGCPSYWG